MGGTHSVPTKAEVDELEARKDELLQKAANAIAEADVFLLATGAGFSADSGLAVYKDIADVPAYHDMGLTYTDLCQPMWLLNDPEVFYGFWGMCFNDYRNTRPHAGYQILLRIREALFNPRKHASMEISQKIRRALQEEEKDLNEDADVAGSFYVFTSNVDEHSQKAGFPGYEVNAIHGTTETWQCADPCSDTCWRAPPGFRFQVDESTMRALEEVPPNRAAVGDDAVGWATNFPKCPACGGNARPRILMFGDGNYIDDDEMDARYNRWRQAALNFLGEDPSRRMVVLEIGAGVRVPTVRFQSEGLMSDGEGQVTVVRVNPDYPLFDGSEGQSRVDIAPNGIPVQAKGLEALERIEEILIKMGKLQSPLAK